MANQAALDDAAAICGSRRISDDDRADVLEARRVRQFKLEIFSPQSNDFSIFLPAAKQSGPRAVLVVVGVVGVGVARRTLL